MGPAAAEAKKKGGGNDPRAYLRAPGCPVDYRTHKASTYDREQQVRALHWRFRVHKAVLNLRPPIDWERNPYGSKAFAARLADLAFLDQLFYVYVASPDFARPKKIRALRMARNIVLHWVRREAEGKVSSETWTDRVAARRALFVAFLARAGACEGVLRKRDARVLLTSIREHGRWLRNPAHYRLSNHGLSLDLGLAALDRYLPRDKPISRGATRGERRYKRTFFRSYDPEGVWLEHSMGYYRHAIKLVDDYLRVVDPFDPDLREVRGRMVTALAWLTAPDRRVAQFGDTNRSKPQEEVRAEASTQSGLWVAPRSGYAVVKELGAGGWLAIASSYHSGVHKHSDELTFELYESGARVVQETGQYHKDRDDYFRFQRSQSAHSTMVIDSTELETEDYAPYGSGIYAWGQGGGWYAVWASNPIAQNLGVAHARLYLYKPGYALLVADSVLANVIHSYRRFFQLGHKLDVTSEGPELRLSTDRLNGALTNTSSAGTGTLRTAYGEENPLSGWWFPRFRERKPRVTASWTTVGQDIDHLTTFSLKNPDIRATLASPLGDDTTVQLTENGVPAGSVRVVRSGTALSVTPGP